MKGVLSREAMGAVEFVGFETLSFLLRSVVQVLYRLGDVRRRVTPGELQVIFTEMSPTD
jgi:hypothetical protein